MISTYSLRAFCIQYEQMKYQIIQVANEFIVQH